MFDISVSALQEAALNEVAEASAFVMLKQYISGNAEIVPLVEQAHKDAGHCSVSRTWGVYSTLIEACPPFKRAVDAKMFTPTDLYKAYARWRNSKAAKAALAANAPSYVKFGPTGSLIEYKLLAAS